MVLHLLQFLHWGVADRKRLCPLGLLAYEQDGMVHGEWTGDNNRTE